MRVLFVVLYFLGFVSAEAEAAEGSLWEQKEICALMDEEGFEMTPWEQNKFTHKYRCRSSENIIVGSTKNKLKNQIQFAVYSAESSKEPSEIKLILNSFNPSDLKESKEKYLKLLTSLLAKINGGNEGYNTLALAANREESVVVNIDAGVASLEVSGNPKYIRNFIISIRKNK